MKIHGHTPARKAGISNIYINPYPAAVHRSYPRCTQVKGERERDQTHPRRKGKEENGREIVDIQQLLGKDERQKKLLQLVGICIGLKRAVAQGGGEEEGKRGSN